MLKKNRRLVTALFFSAVSGGCASQQVDAVTNQPYSDAHDYALSDMPLNAIWLRDTDGEVLRDPQTSGLVAWRNNTLVSISDGSAHESQVLKLLQIDPDEYRIINKIPFSMSPKVAQSCFAEFLSERPDLEALVVDPDDDQVFYMVTEDASDHQLSPQCQVRFKHTGSAEFPTLLLRIELNEDSKTALMTHARALQFAPDMQIGNFPNDGIEGMTFGRDRRLFLALEKDQNYHARIFSLHLTDEFWASEAFAPVTDQKLKIPVFDDKQPHPINALAFASYQGSDWLVAAARNDNQLWMIDTAGEQATRIISLSFHAQVTESSTDCPDFELMDNYSMEGMAVAGDTLWIVNDPWKYNYMKNLQCPTNKGHYEKMAPLLTSIKLGELFN